MPDKTLSDLQGELEGLLDDWSSGTILQALAQIHRTSAGQALRDRDSQSYRQFRRAAELLESAAPQVDAAVEGP